MASTKAVDPYAGRTYVPYTGDYASYGYGPEATFFNYGVPAPPPGSSNPPPSSGGGGSGSQSASNQNNGSGSGTGSGGNAAGAAANAGSAGDFAGHPGADSSGFGGFGGFGAADSAAQAPMGPGGVSYPTIPGWLDAITSAAGALLPLPYSLPFTVGRLGLKAYDMFGATDPNRQSMGMDRLSALQVLGGFFGSPYGNLRNPEVANAEQTKGTIPAGWGDTGITAEGGPMPGWQLGPFEIGGGQGTLSYANDLKGLPGSSAYDQHQITVAQQQAANGTLPTYSAQPAGWNFGLEAAPASSAALPTYASPTGAPTGPAIVAGNDQPAARPANSGMVAPDGTHQIPKAFVGTMQAAQFGYDSNNNYVGGNTATSGNPGNFGAGQGAPGTVAGGTFGNQDTAGMAGPVNRNESTGMLSRAASGGRIAPLTLRQPKHRTGIAAAARREPPQEPTRLLAAGAPNPPESTGLAAFDRGGFVRSRSAGRADAVNTKVPANTYIMPADVVAALGQGNSLHGAHVLDHIVRRVHARPQLAGGGRLPRNGKADVHVALSGGEYRIPPSAVTAIGRGDVDRGAAHLDQVVMSLRGRFADHLQSLPPPRK